MDFNLSETQADVRDLYSKFFFSDRSSSEIVGVAEPLGFDASMWRALVEIGTPGLGVSVEAGGSGLGLGELM
jgi:alkylation response protein AidB-like acyl-CoA dehydrogenase